jgi:hypothetical protein
VREVKIVLELFSSPLHLKPGNQAASLWYLPVPVGKKTHHLLSSWLACLAPGLLV